LRRELYFSPNIYQIGLGVCLVSLSAFFLGLVIAYAFRIESQGSWRTFHVPACVWVSTLILAASSALLEAAKYALRRAKIAAYRYRLRGCIALGLTFLVLQASSAMDLAGQGVATESNPHGSAFYVFITIHGIHLWAV
jgi:heme/copper-type cytochrome/quinol oxidase subunit 3